MTQYEAEHGHISELLELFALDALDPAEAARVQRHVEACDVCRAEVAHLNAALLDLDEAVAAAPSPAPPGALRARVLASLPSEESLRPVGGAPQPLSAAPGRSPRLARFRLRVVTAAAVIAFLVLAASLVRNGQLSHSLAQERQQRAELASIVNDREIVLEVVDSSTTVRRVLRAATPDSRSYGKLFTRPDLPHVVAMAARLPAAPEGQQYQLWLTLDGEQRFAGAFDVNADGFGQLVFDADRNGPLYQSALVTLQAPSDAAPGEVVLSWTATP